MPGIVIFRRRWSFGSDDLVVPVIFLICLHTAWLVGLVLVVVLADFDSGLECSVDLHHLIVGFITVLSIFLLLECAIALVSSRGTILTPAPRASIEYLLYARIVVGIGDLTWLIIGAVWASKHYTDCALDTAKKALCGVMACNWLMILAFLISMWCTFDTAGRKWVKMKRYQDTMKERRKEKRRPNRRQSGSRRNWRQRKAFRAYEESWDRRFQILCCCVERKGHNRSSMSEIAALFTDFFRDLDVVPSDVVAGLVLLRKYQQQRMELIISQGSTDVYQYLSGVPITPQTQFLQLSQPDVLESYQKIVHFMRFALAAYGWPVYMMMYPATWMCRLIPMLRCCCCKRLNNTELVDDNCCLCNFNVAKKISGLYDVDLVYATYHVDIGETPFFVALDHSTKKVVVAIRGTLSLQDVLTDLKAEPETLPLETPRDDWQGHKGMVQAAVYIKNKLIDGRILEAALARNEEKETSKYELVLVGHSLGAGTAAILSILLKDAYPKLHCYSYSPPGGLLTLPCVQATKSFITSIVVGKDCVPRIGLPQLEVLRTDILNQIKMTTESKWKIITRGLMCCNSKSGGSLVDTQERDVTAHPCNSAIGLSAHLPLYPPGQLIHVVRSHPKRKKKGCGSREPIYQAVWANNGDFDEVLVSPTMISDHMPANVLDALERVVVRAAPEKPCHTLSEEERREMLNHQSTSSLATPCSTSSFPIDQQCFIGSEIEPSAMPVSAATPHPNAHIVDEKRNLIFPFPNASLPNNNCDFMTHTMQPKDDVAPLASPETISMCSGVRTFSQDSLRHSMHGGSNANTCESLSQTQPLLAMVKEDSSNHENDSVSSDYKPHLSQRDSGNTISVEAEIGNEVGSNQMNSECCDLTPLVVQKFDESVECSRSNGGFPTLSSESPHQNESNQDLPSETTASCPPPKQGMQQPEDSVLVTLKGAAEEEEKEGDAKQLFIEKETDRQGADFTAEEETQISVPHEPSKSNQTEYGHPNSYYTQGGVGFPHNGFHLSAQVSEVDQETEIIL